jgi:DNA helicase HerA-like ATPase
VGVAAPAYTGFPTVFWDVFGESGHPMRATVSDLGPLLFARILNLNETQEGVLALVFKIADDNGLLLLDLKDLRALLEYVGNNPHDFLTSYGNVSAASVGAIQRGLLALQQQGADKFIGEPMLNIDDLLQTDGSGKGNINILTADKLLGAPALYSTLLLWLLSEFYERLPEVGDRDKQARVLLRRAHLLFTDAQTAARQDRAGRAADPLQGRRRLFRHPESARRAGQGPGGSATGSSTRCARSTPRDQKAVAAPPPRCAQSEARYRKVITELGVGEALVSLLDERDGGRGRGARTSCPASRIGPITADERKAILRLRQSQACR